MELLLTLTHKELLNELKGKADGAIYGSLFSLKYHYSLEEIKEINNCLNEQELKSYICLDAFVSENDLDELDNYFKFLKDLNLAGIYFADLACVVMARKYGLADLLIYDPSTLNTNIKDVKFYLDEKIGVVLGRELTYEEDKYLLETYPKKLDIQAFGHLRMSYSKRSFISNYFKELKLTKDVDNKDNLTLIEESRSYKLPIKENKFGTTIYTDYSLLMYEELNTLKNLINRAIIDSEFIAMGIIKDVLNDLSLLNEHNTKELEDKLINKYQEVEFSKGYLYQKTVDKKENE